MPNWCANGLLVTGPEEDIALFIKKARGKKRGKDRYDFSFEPFLPMPEQLNNITKGGCIIDGKKYDNWIEDKDGTRIGLDQSMLEQVKAQCGHTDWYERNCAVLGTKWDVQGKLTTRDTGRVTYSFESAWSPPEEGVRAISEQYPTLTFCLDFEEPGVGFKGMREFKNGECIDSSDEDMEFEEDEDPE